MLTSQSDPKCFRYNLHRLLHILQGPSLKSLKSYSVHIPSYGSQICIACAIRVSWHFYCRESGISELILFIEEAGG